MSRLCHRFSATLVQRHFFSAGFRASQQQAATVNRTHELPECDRFGSVSGSEVLRSEYLPDDDDNYDKMESMKRRRPITHYDMKLKRLWQAGGPEKMKEMMHVFEQMQYEDRHEPDAHHITMLISGCAEFGLVEKAFFFFDFLLKRNSRPTKAGVTALLNACAESRDRAKALDKLALLTDWIRETSYPCNLIQYNAMVKAYAKQGDLKSAFLVLKDMANEGHVADSQTYAMLLMGCITDRYSGFSHAIRILREMRRHMPLTVHAVNLFLRVIRDSGVGSEDHLRRLLPNDALQAQVTFLPCNQLQVGKHSERQDQVLPSPLNLLTQNYSGQEICLDMASLRVACNKLALVGGYSGILRLMDESKIKPSLATISALLQVLPDCTAVENQLIKDAEIRDVKLNTDFFNILIKKRALRHDWKDAHNVLLEMQIRHIEIDIMTFGTLALTCFNRSLGNQLLSDMRNSGIKLNKEIAGAFVYKACQKFDFEYLTDILNAMEQDAVRPDPKMLEKIEESKLAAQRTLVQKDHGNEVDKRFRLLTNDTFDRFNLFYSSWLRRNGVDFVEPEEKQFDFDIKPNPRQKMFEFERDMRRRLSELRGQPYHTPRGGFEIPGPGDNKLSN